MDYVKFGKTGLDVSRLCLGCMTFGVAERGSHAWTLSEEASRPLIKQAIELGINFLDTANVYSDGTSEEIVGRALKALPASRRPLVFTKFGLGVNVDAPVKSATTSGVMYELGSPIS